MAKQNKQKKPGFFGTLRDMVLVAVSAVLALLLLVSAKFTLVSPVEHSVCIYPNYALPFLFLLNTVSLGYWIWRKKGWALLSVLALLLCWGEQKVWFPVHLGDEAAPLTEKEYKILTYNTMQFSNGNPHQKNKPNKVLEYLRSSQADIICLQETMCYGGKRLSKADVRKSLSAYPYQCSLPDDNSNRMWLFSKYPILKSRRIKYRSDYNASFYCDVQLDGKVIRVINNHLESNKLTSRDKDLYKDIKLDTESISQGAFTLNRKLGPAASLRAKQADAVAREIAESPYPVIVCGDFNDIPNSYTYRRISKGLQDAWASHATGFGITFHESLYRFRIDYILHSPSIKSRQPQVDRLGYSDHYPLWTYFQL